MFRFSLAALFVATSLVYEVQSLSCIPCGQHPCQDPVCCESGFYTSGICGCCAQCAKAKNQSCGGAFGSEGSCAKGLRCVSSDCLCFTEKGNQCIFPFEFQGKIYGKCTTHHSENGKPWCATKVYSNNTVVDGQWEDCEENCQCNDFQQGQGRCVEQDKVGDFVAEENNDLGEQQSRIDQCPRVKTPSDLQDFCKCSKKALTRDLQGNLKGGCVNPDGYCFLENILDPSNPSASCFSDTEWSQSDGQFYSRQACLPSLASEDPSILFPTIDK